MMASNLPFLTVPSEPGSEVSSTVPSRSNSVQTQGRTSIWDYTRPPVPPEPEKDEKKKRIAYCQSCKYKTSTHTNFRVHLENIHDIVVGKKKTRY